MRTGLRVAVGIILLFGIFGLGIHYGSTYDSNWPHPTGDQLATDYDSFVNERVLLIGEVTSTDPAHETIVVEITDSADDVAAEITVQDASGSVEPGGTVQVYGILTVDRTMTDSETVVVNRDATDSQYKLAVSIVGILLAVGYFFRYWRLDIRGLAFEQRPTDPTEVSRDD